MRLFFSVGEPSGDEHAAALIDKLKAKDSSLTFCGYGGPEMQRAGCDLHFQLTDLAVMGIVKVLPLLFQFVSLVRRARKLFRQNPPDMVVLVDFPGFNWWIAKAAKREGIPVVYYLPPQMWAWAPWRIKKIKRYVDHVVCALPFEPEWYAERGVTVEYVGHPFFDEVAEQPLDYGFIEQLATGTATDNTVVGVLPGSRTQEVTRNFPIQVQMAKSLSQTNPGLTFPVACYKPAHQEWCERYLATVDDAPAMTFHRGKTSEIIEAAEVCIMVSGSVSLELLARKTPAVVIYACGRVFATIAKTMMQIDTATLPNLMAGKRVYPEFPFVAGDRSQLDVAIGILRGWLSDQVLLDLSRQQLQRLLAEVGQTGSCDRTADFIVSVLPTRTGSLRAAA